MWRTLDFHTPLSQRQSEDSFANGHKLKELYTNGDEKYLKQFYKNNEAQKAEKIKAI